jgi:hypothetical protein
MKKKNQKSVLFTLFATLTLVCFQATAAGQTANESKLANMVGGGSSVRLDVLVANSGSTLIISAPDGRTFSQRLQGRGGPGIQHHRQSRRASAGRRLHL